MSDAVSCLPHLCILLSQPPLTHAELPCLEHVVQFFTSTADGDHWVLGMARAHPDSSSSPLLIIDVTPPPPPQNNLRYWAQKTRLPLVQLVDDVPAADTGNTPEYLISEQGIKEISE
jgi:hypothetical protein